MSSANQNELLKYFAISGGISSIDQRRALAVLSGVIPLIDSISASLTQNSRSRSGSEVHISADSGDNGGNLATSRRDPVDGSFHIVITAALLHRIYNQTQKIHDLKDRKYDPSVYVAFATSAALCHEFAHVVMGHLQDRVRPSDENIRADEVSADFRAGVMILGLFQSRRYKLQLQNGWKLRTSHDFFEAALVGFASLCTVLQTVHQDTKKYHRPALRVTHFMGGFLSIIMRTKFMVEPQAQKRFLATMAFLREIGWDFDDPMAFNTVMSGDKLDEKKFFDETMALMDTRVPAALNRSPLLAPHRDRRGSFH